ncbi:SURF1 family protein [Yoonia sp. SS1-5]|uniref:SURF1-like protein n=1 Tax=Yoonia rhodophyticola TaxID=3137370 RepID=A0AAN0MI44_9RHOB
MLRKILFPLILGIAGCGVLISLGLWQVERLAWKEDILANINARLAEEPGPLRDDVTEEADEYTRVTLQGRAVGDELHVLTSGTQAGTGYRVITAFETDKGTIILLDKGLLPLEAKTAPPPDGPVQVTGTLLWPDDKNNNTPAPDLDKNIWFARDVTDMSAKLQTAPLMVVASSTSPADPRLTPLPVSTTNIKNDHLEYAITWFLLALVWGIMSLYLIYRTTTPKDG